MLAPKTQNKLKHNAPSSLLMTAEFFKNVNVESQQQLLFSKIELFQCMLDNDNFTQSELSNGPQTFVNLGIENFKVTLKAVI